MQRKNPQTETETEIKSMPLTISVAGGEKCFFTVKPTITLGEIKILIEEKTGNYRETQKMGSNGKLFVDFNDNLSISELIDTVDYSIEGMFVQINRRNSPNFYNHEELKKKINDEINLQLKKLDIYDDKLRYAILEVTSYSIRNGKNFESLSSWSFKYSDFEHFPKMFSEEDMSIIINFSSTFKDIIFSKLEQIMESIQLERKKGVETCIKKTINAAILSKIKKLSQSISKESKDSYLKAIEEVKEQNKEESIKIITKKEESVKIINEKEMPLNNEMVKELTKKLGSKDAPLFINKINSLNVISKEIEFLNNDLIIPKSVVTDISTFQNELSSLSKCGRAFEVSIREDRIIINTVRHKQYPSQNLFSKDIPSNNLPQEQSTLGIKQIKRSNDFPIKLDSSTEELSKINEHIVNIYQLINNLISKEINDNYDGTLCLIKIINYLPYTNGQVPQELEKKYPCLKQDDSLCKEIEKLYEKIKLSKDGEEHINNISNNLESIRKLENVRTSNKKL